MTETVTFARGNPDERGFCCITTRDNPWDVWLRAENHCLRMIDLHWKARIRAALDCRIMAEAVMKMPRPPQRSVKPIRWGWYPGFEKTPGAA